VAQAFGLAGLPTQCVPRSFAFFARASPELFEGAGAGNAGAKCFDHVSTTKLNSTRSIAAAPGKNEGRGTLSGNGLSAQFVKPYRQSLLQRAALAK
jgi:hypothetical protein